VYYVETKTEKYDITTSYVSEKQARQYGGIPFGAELHLQGENIGEYFVDDHNPEELPYDVGRVRTIFKSKLDGKDAGKFSLYLQDDQDRWYFSGITFASYSDANQAVKGPLSRTFGDMLILENDDPELTRYED